METVLFIVGVAIVFAIGYAVNKKRNRDIPQPPAGTTPERGDRPGGRK